MKIKYGYSLVVIFLVFLILTGVALAMASDNNRLGWFTPLTGGGGSAGSTHYAVDFTIGQTVIGASDNVSYGVCLGYWCGAETGYLVRLPVIMNDFSNRQSME